MAKGALHPRWNPARIVASTGYVKVRVGTTHPLADSKGYCYEHRLVWTGAGRTFDRPGVVLHHLNGDKLDNRLENLQMLLRAEHTRIHLLERGRNADGTFAKRVAA